MVFAGYKKFFLKFFSATFIVRFFGLIKDLMFGWIIGPSRILDIFFLLITIPTILNTTWNKALETVFLTNYEKDQHSTGKNSASEKLNILVYNFTVLSFVIYLVISATLPFIIYNFYSEYISGYLIPTIFIINFVFVIETYLLGIKVLCFSQNRFFLPSILPIFQSVIIIIGLLSSNKITLFFLAILFTIGAFLQFSFFLRKEFTFFLSLLKKKISLSKIKFFLKQIFLLSLAWGLSSINLLIDQSFALSLGEGSNTYIHYGNYFLLIFTFLVVNNISTIYFPQFQKYVISNQHKQLEKDTQKVIRFVLLINLFIIIFLLNNGYFALDLILGYGNISSQDLKIIYYCALGYSGAFVGLGINAVLTRILIVYNAYNMIVRVALINSILNIFFNYIFSQLFGIWGIALSTSVTLLILITIYVIYLRRHYKIKFIDETDKSWFNRYSLLILILGILEFFYLSHFYMQTVDFVWNVVVFCIGIIVISILVIMFKIIQIKDRKIIF